jgi:hypothetical protein
VDGGAWQPVAPGIPILEMSHDGSKLLNASHYISVSVPFDSKHFNPMMGNQLANNRAQTDMEIWILSFTTFGWCFMTTHLEIRIDHLQWL